MGDLYFKGNGVFRNYTTARRWYARSCRLGDEQAAFNLGYLYLHGLGVEKGLDAARRHYAIAAQAGIWQAQAALETLGDPQSERLCSVACH
jgi:hypothetical protein